MYTMDNLRVSLTVKICVQYQYYLYLSPVNYANKKRLNP
ncbi:hypothetical protein Nizo1838_1572 [Lactiplantibacillus plantarum]|nr:hypothetical protein Nizo1838_1572 [Lactiplantibacillus plantarum]KZT91658.1 hypothetical protein Nizo2256_0252 [Lactiplantibacillus plantarum]